MLKKLFYIGLGISIIVAKKSVSYILAAREQMEEQFESDADSDLPGTEQTSEPVQEDVLAQATSDVQTADGESATAPVKNIVSVDADDLTEIKGIGPTYAKRLAAAGIATFEALSQQSPETVREITQAKGQTADAESWIAQASDLAV